MSVRTARPTGALRAHPRFIADAMQGTLARKLRIFGFDTLYFREGADSDLEKIARHEGRIILTSDKALYQHSRTRGVRAILVEGRTDRARLISISRQGEQGV